MKKAGDHVVLAALAAKDHRLSRGPTRVRMLAATAAFLERHDPAR